MIYKTIQFSQREGNWVFNFRTNNGEREETETTPNANGWYHFPATMTEKEAFKKLRSCMVRAHKKEIKRIEESLAKLQALKFSLMND